VTVAGGGGEEPVAVVVRLGTVWVLEIVFQKTVVLLSWSW
jgi:hypothetical protein